MDLFSRLSGARLYELLLAFNETEPVKTLKTLSEFGLLKVISPGLLFNNELESALQSMFETLAWFNLLSLKKVLTEERCTLWLYCPLSKEGRKEHRNRKYNTAPRVRELIAKGITHSPKDILNKLPLNDPAGLYHLLNGVNLEILLFSMAQSKSKQKQKAISQYLIELRKNKSRF